MPHTEGDPLVVETASGAVRGVAGEHREGAAGVGATGSVRHWRGIPYAAAPVGPLRFRRPQPAPPWEGVRNASAFGHAAPQHENRAITLPPGVTQSEDCLTLNVTAPDADGPHPVMVWVHGGAYVAGSSAQPLFEPSQLAAEGGVVVVSLNYRLGALGFLDFSSFSDPAGSPEEFEANVGLHDILAGLAWVQQNIAAFGGDPGSVTLFGESAGGGCVTTLLATPAAEGLFHRAIAESSPATSVYDAERAATVAGRYLRLVGLEPAEAGRLRELEPGVLSQAAFDLVAAVSAEAPGTLAIAPVVDGVLVPEPPVDAFREGRQLRVPLVIGTNHDEASLFKLMKSPLMPITQASVHAMFEAILAERPDLGSAAPADLEARIEAAYPRFPRHGSPAELSRDAGFRMPSIWLAAAHSRVAPTRMYRFDHAPAMLRMLGIGATHGAEIAYVFGTLDIAKKDPSFDLGGLKAARRLSSEIRGRWAAFAQAGEPEVEGGQTWPLYDETTRSTLVFDARGTVVDDPDPEIRHAWGDAVIAFR
ncbi:carboxylesterase/lipase family protein [Herbiconiux sp. CPCC 203407]|uniref:Carboxylic ester hydrolase n=1 Tax=Herbiconiux oxytropis TaxID=2970915 RepID=A0AA41XGJ1_9MICO|nr:carboxylesterase/lipase family protein [Herbiconiux oxytropis]MCS5721434.1 carboxylesterase/lipase family protein [Herbiconiux oxytropis]MCS5724511.1 carboxylesterase/lipase family protein [Herbiconiux oxytropis]